MRSDPIAERVAEAQASIGWLTALGGIQVPKTTECPAFSVVPLIFPRFDAIITSNTANSGGIFDTPAATGSADENDAENAGHEVKDNPSPRCPRGFLASSRL